MAAPRQNKGQRGYTVMEVMMALAVLTIGASGVVAMQKTTLVGNTRARDLGTASAIASSWVERLRVDALRWKDTNSGLSTIAGTRWLNVLGDDFPSVAGLEGEWFRPAIDVTQDLSPEADVRGQDANYTDAAVGFCTNIRLTQLTPTLARAEVRVFWLRHQGGGTLGGAPLCSDDPSYIAGIEAERERYHFVYLTTGLFRNDS